MTAKRLERLVRLKRLAEDAHAAELAARRDGLSAARRELDAVHARMDATDDALGGSTSGADLAQAAGYRDHLSQEARRQTDDVVRRAQTVREGEGDVQAAWRDRRLFEAVHERATQREATGEATRAHKEMEAIALTRYGRGDS